MDPWIEHTGDGTLVHDTDRDDTQLRQALKAAGFRWGRSIGAWYLPRNWTFAVRGQRVRQLVASLEQAGRTIDVQERRERERTSAEIEADRVARAEARAERMTDRADAAETRSEALRAESRRMAEHIPPGQPLLVDHHSYSRDLAYRKRMHAKMDKSLAEHRKAQHYDRRAGAAESEARKNENPALIARRLDRLRADRRRIQRRIDGTEGYWSKPATGEYLARLQSEAADLDERIAWNEQALAAAEAERGRLWASADFRTGDHVLVRGHWYPVRRVNRKTVTVTPLMDLGEDKGRSWTDTVPYDEIRGRRRDGIEHTTPPADEAAAARALSPEQTREGPS